MAATTGTMLVVRSGSAPGDQPVPGKATGPLEDRDRARRAVQYDDGASPRWWHRARGAVGLVAFAIIGAVLMVGAVLGLLGLLAYLAQLAGA